MSGEARKVKSAFIPPPVEGLNLIAPPGQLGEQEARSLLNYWVFDSGIRQIPPFTQTITYTGANSNPVLLNSYDSLIFYSAQNKIFKLSSATSGSPTDVTGAATITSGAWNPCVFNKRLFLFNGVDNPLYHDYGGGNVVAFTATGPTVTTLKQGTGYKSRLYAVQTGSTVVWYGAVGAFSGTFTSFDIGDVLTFGSSTLLCCFTWSYNQGLQNEELFVFLTNRGEVLIYSGDNPGAANWQLVSKTTIPFPGGYDVAASGQPFCRVGNDVYITTQRGVIPLSSIIAGVPVTDSTYSISRKIKNQVSNDTNGGAVDRINPFVYFRDVVSLSSLYVMNYERGAWSSYMPVLPAVDAKTQIILNVRFFGNYMLIATGRPDATAGSIGYVDLSASASSGMTYTWKSRFSNFGTPTQKHLKMLRVHGLNYGASSTFKNTAYCSVEFTDAASPTTDTRSTSVAADTNTIQEVVPPAMGRWLSPVLSRVGVDSINERNEIQGIEMIYEEGGYY